MAKKVNVLSNTLDQAPKTKEAWYWKVVSAMKNDIAEAMSWTNRPKILDNDLDQAPKTRAAWYNKVLEDLAPDIKVAMEGAIIRGSDVLAEYMDQNREKIPLSAIINLKPWEKLSFEVKREKKQVRGFSEAVWHPAFLWDFNNFNGFYSRDGSIQPGETSLIIVVEADKKYPLVRDVHAEQLEFPPKNAMLMSWMFFHNPNVSDEKFKKILENSKTEQKTEENEASENQEKKQSFKDKVKGMFGK